MKKRLRGNFFGLLLILFFFLIGDHKCAFANLISDQDESLTPQERINLKKYRQNTAFAPLGTYEGREAFLQNSDQQLLNDVKNEGRSVFNLVYYYDSYDYEDRNNIFQRTYETGDKARKFGAIHLGQDFIIYRGFVDFATGINVGASYNTGKGVFASDRQKSNAIFKLWLIPVDLDLVVEAPLGNWGALSLTGGPSGMFLAQTRSDYQKGERKKRRRQFSWGYFGKARMKFNITHLFPGVGFDFYKTYRISKFGLNLEARYHSYSNFQNEDIKMSGVSFGAGFSFEYF